jgi:hypothetical protein
VLNMRLGWSAASGTEIGTFFLLDENRVLRLARLPIETTVKFIITERQGRKVGTGFYRQGNFCVSTTAGTVIEAGSLPDILERTLLAFSPAYSNSPA